jgi:hypothetical protein
VRRLIVALACALLSLAALAQGSPPPPCWPKRFGPLPIPGGTGSEVISESIMDNGVYFAWRCPGGAVAYRVVLDEWKSLHTWELATIFLLAPSVIEALQKLWPMYGPRQAACTPQDPCDPNWQRVAQAAIAAASELPLPDGTPQPEPKPEPDPPPPPPPPAGRWVTSGLSTFNTQNNALAGYVGGAGSRGIPCDCTRPIKVGAATYCTFQGAPGPHVVAACKQVAP